MHTRADLQGSDCTVEGDRIAAIRTVRRISLSVLVLLLGCAWTEKAKKEKRPFERSLVCVCFGLEGFDVEFGNEFVVGGFGD